MSYKNFPLGRELTKQSYICILGDFGCVWRLDNEDNYWLDWLEDKNFTTLFIPGNHECYPLLRSFPTEQWRGGVIRRIRPTVMMLERGEIFNINNNTFFCFGAARSVDKVYRKEGVSWWQDEQANRQEYENGINNLEKYNFNVDYILTHCAPNYLVDKLYPYENQHDDTTNYLEKNIRQQTNFKKWMMGHYHLDRNYDNNKYNIFYQDIMELMPDGQLIKVN